MHIHLNTADGVPIYLQIVQQVKYLVAAGRLRPGEELPPIRALAEKLLVNPNTVARAYRDLEQLGVVSKRSTTGTFVADDPSALQRRDALAGLVHRVDDLLREASRHHVESEELVELVRQRHRAKSTNKESAS